MNYYPIYKSIVLPLQEKCTACGKILRKKSKNNKKSKVKASSKKNSKGKKNPNNKKQFKYNYNDIGGKTRQYNDRKNFEFEVLGCYTIW